MLQKLKQMLSGQGGGTDDISPTGAGELGSRETAGLALLVEAAVLDGVFGEEERRVIEHLCAERFALGEEKISAIIDELEVEVRASAGVHRYTTLVKEHFDHEERVDLVEMLWEVVYADNELHDYEASLLRRIGGLIYVSDRERGDARKRVLARRAEKA